MNIFKLNTDTTSRLCDKQLKTDLLKLSFKLKVVMTLYMAGHVMYTRRAQDGVTKRAQELIFSFSARSKACVHKLISF